ncbi:MAG TPA: ABC transporter ATP-binding protein [Thermodesulfobacteriota bacterium]
MLAVDALRVSYGPVRALDGVSFEVAQGELVALLGANGAGKTTTLKSIAGLLAPDGGSVRYRGASLAGRTPAARVRAGIALVPEGRRVFAHSTVLENLELGAVTRPDRREVARSLARVFDLFPVLAKRRSQPAGSLSGGEQQMLAIGRALMSSPSLLLLDEPSMGLAPKIVTQIFELILVLNEEGTTVLMVEQNARLALEIVDRAYVLEGGRTVLSGTSEALAGDRAVADAYLGA